MSGINEKEKSVLNIVGLAHEEFVKLDSYHPSEMKDWVDAIHNLQRIIGMRSVVRDNPNLFSK